MMKLREILSKSYSRFVLLFVLVFILVQFLVIVSILFFNNQLMEKQYSDVAENVTGAFSGHLHNSIEKAEADLRTLISQYAQIRILSGENENSRILVTEQLLSTMSSFIDATAGTDAYILYNSHRDVFLLSRSGRFTYDDAKALERDIQRIAPDSFDSSAWQLSFWNDRCFLVRYYYYYDCVFAAVFNLGHLLSTSPYASLFGETQSMALLDADHRTVASAGGCGLDYLQSGAVPPRYFVSVTPADYGNLQIAYLSAYAPYGFQNSILLVITLVCAVSLVMLVVFMRHLEREILQPIEELMKTTRIVEGGNYRYRARLQCRSREFRSLAASVNSMIEEIIHRRILSYEQIIRQQKMELKYLQMQLRPHFFLNALSTIHAMSYRNDNQRIRQFIDLFSQNIRYLFAAGFQTVPLSGELAHVRDYIRCQDLLYPDCVFSYIEAAPGTEDWKVPQMLLHTLVENIYKHTVTPDRLTSLFISASIVTAGGEELLQLIVEDDGEGYPAGVMEQVNQSSGSIPVESSQIGLLNITYMLRLMYGRLHLLELSNKGARGSVARALIPAKPVETRPGGAEGGDAPSTS